MIRRSAAIRSHHTRAVRIIDHDSRIKLFRQRTNLVKRRDIAIHGEDAIRDNQPLTHILRGDQRIPEAVHIAVLVNAPLCLRQTAAIDNRCMIQAIGDNRIFRFHNRRNRAGIRCKSALENKDIFDMLELGNQLFELVVEGDIPDDWADGTAARTDG